jgi:hypothetical protein
MCLHAGLAWRSRHAENAGSAHRFPPSSPFAALYWMTCAIVVGGGAPGVVRTGAALEPRFADDPKASRRVLAVGVFAGLKCTRERCARIFVGVILVFAALVPRYSVSGTSATAFLVLLAGSRGSSAAVAAQPLAPPLSGRNGRTSHAVPLRTRHAERGELLVDHRWRR